MDEPTRNEWMSFSEALEGYLEAREEANAMNDFRRQKTVLAEMRACAAQMDYLVEKRNDENK